MNWILIATVLLVLAIIGLIFRTINLLDVFSGSFQKRASVSNKVNAALFPIFFIVGMVAAVVSFMNASEDFLPAASSEHGVRTDEMFWFSMGVIGIVFVATHILLFFFPFQYQYKEGQKAYFYPENHRLELIWTVIPAIVLASLVFTGWKAWTDITNDAPSNAYQIELVGKQFNWIVRYPGKDGQIGKYNFRKIDAINEVGMDFEDKTNFDDFMANEIHLPLGKPVLLKIHARDVLHSVFMPHFRVKMDAVPGMPTRFWFVPTKTTADMRTETGNPNFNYELACTEVCGRNHFGMRKLIIVEDEEDYLKWLNSQESFLSKNPDFIKNVPEKYRAEAEKSLAKPTAVPAQAAL
jgi:cytochrome c oxidase subunit 2